MRMASLPVVLVSGLLCCVSTVFAQDATQNLPLERGVKINRVGNNLDKRFDAVSKGTTSAPVVTVQEAQTKAPEGADTIRFTLLDVDVRGATVLDSATLRSLYESKLNTEISLADAYQLAAQITSLYGNAGYVLSRAIIPAQTIENGVFAIQVIEGYIDDVVVEGMDGIRADLFAYYRQQLTASRPLHIDVLERYQLLANDLAGVRFKSVLSPSKLKPGAATLTMSASLQRFEGAVYLDNRGSEYSGPWQLLVSGAVNNLMQRLDSTRLRLATVPNATEELRYWQLTHSQVLSAEGLSLTLDFNANEMEPDSDLFRLLELRTKGRSAAVYVSYPFIRTRQQNLSVKGGLQYRDYESTQLAGFSRDKLHMLNVELQYDRADAWMGGGVNMLSVNYVQGVDFGGDQVYSRVYAKPDFNKLEWLLQRNQTLSTNTSLSIRAAGQYADESLPSAEEYGLGGEFSVRGYEPSEWTGEKAYSASLEWRYNHSFTNGSQAQAYLFYDLGKVWRQNPQIGQGNSDEASANGVGVRANFGSQLAANLEVANPLSVNFNQQDPGVQIYARILVRF